MKAYEWIDEAISRSTAIREVCNKHLVAHQPTLIGLSAALEFKKEMRSFTEAAPDPVLYAVLRALSRDTYDPLPVTELERAGLRNKAMNFLHQYLEDLITGTRNIDDSSNAWWGLRTGIDNGDDRFYSLLPKIAEKFFDLSVPSEVVSRQSAVPEIYEPLRTASYTLSNIQAIFEHNPSLDIALEERLHNIILTICNSLLKTPRKNQLYLSSVHHEGLRNYLDYVRLQKRPIE
jgi:predicted AAA+ superfamily ATPase